MTEDKSKRNRLEDSGANDYIHEESTGFGLLEANNKETSGRSNVKMADPVKTTPAPEPARTVAESGNTPEPKPVEIDDRGQNLRMPPNPAPKKFSDYDYYVASVWLQIERNAGLHVPYEEKARILKGITGAEPPAQLPGIIEQLKEKHYSRNLQNDPPDSEAEVPGKWRPPLEHWKTRFHTQGTGNKNNVKYVSPDGHKEGIYDKNGRLVQDPLNMGTYNYYSPKTDETRHVIYDVLPYFFWGNTPADPSTISQRLEVMIEATSERDTQIKKDQIDALCVTYPALSYDDFEALFDQK